MLEFLCARLHSRGVRTVILTLGKRGAFLSDVNGQPLVPGFKVKTVDSTAAYRCLH
jgi:ribokinase